MKQPPASTDTTPTARSWRRLLVAGRGRWLATIFAIAACGFLLMPDPGPLPGVRYLAFDAYQTIFPRIRTAQPAVIVAIDDRSLAAVGQWPWPRDKLARLIDRIAARKPAVIGADILFAEPDRTSPERLAGPLGEYDPALAESLLRLPSHDAQLGDAFARTTAVLGIIGSDSAGTGGESLAPARIIGAPPALQSFRFGQRSVADIDRGASGHGLFNAELDDGVVRRVPLVAMVAGLPVLSLPLECLRVAAGEPFFTVRNDPAKPLRVVIGDLAVPAQSDGRLFVNYAGHSPARYLSAVDVLEGRDDPDDLAGRVALLGVTGQGLVDHQLIPNGERLPGVEVHAEVIENVFEGSLLYRPEFAVRLEALVFVLLAALAIAWVPRVSPLRSSLLFAFNACLLLGGGLAAFHFQRQLFDPLTPLLGLTALHATLVLATLVMIDLERRRLAARLALEREAAARTAGELDAARRIQTGMLPRPEKVLANERRLDLFAQMRPAREVGGDLYDFFYLDPRRLFAVVGDVSGKGLAAALFMAVSKSLTKSSSLRGASGLGDLLEQVNIELARDNPDDLFVTLLAIVLDLDSGRLEYCNAGHEPLLLVRNDGSVQVLDEGGGPPLCVFDYIGYTSTGVNLQPGEWLALASDGVTEAMAADGSLFGRERLKALLEGATQGRQGVEELGASVLAQVDRFEQGVDAADDQTLLLLRWNGRPPTPAD